MWKTSESEYLINPKVKVRRKKLEKPKQTACQFMHVHRINIMCLLLCSNMLNFRIGTAFFLFTKALHASFHSPHKIDG